MPGNHNDTPTTGGAKQRQTVLDSADSRHRELLVSSSPGVWNCQDSGTLPGKPRI